MPPTKRRAVVTLLALPLTVLCLACEPEVRQLGRKKVGVDTSAGTLGKKDKKKATALKTVRVGQDQEALDFTRKDSPRQELPQIDAFGDLPTDTVAGTSTRPAVAEAPSQPNMPVTVLSKIQLITRPARRGQLIATPSWTSGHTELLRPVSLKVGEQKSIVLGDATDGCELKYAVGWRDDKDQIPVGVELRMWGSRTANMRFTALLGPDDGKTFNAATREGDQIRFDLAIDAPPEVKTPDTLREIYDRQRQQQQSPAPQQPAQP